MAQRPLERDFAAYIHTITADPPFTAQLRVGQDIFIGRQHIDAPDNCVLIMGLGGGRPDPHLPLRDDELQLVVRNKSYEEGNTLAENLLQTLTRTIWRSLATGGKFALFVLASSGIIHLGKDIQGREEFAINFVFRIRENT